MIGTPPHMIGSQISRATSNDQSHRLMLLELRIFVPRAPLSCWCSRDWSETHQAQCEGVLPHAPHIAQTAPGTECVSAGRV
jgi:hypothetical protein